jgi:tRNA(adenine34) deaminase
MLNTDTYFMKEALKQAKRAFEEGEIPVGAIIVAEGQVISRAYNQVERLKDPTAHAEMIAITAASNFLASKYLTGCILYVTLEPCAMCKGAIAEAQIGKVVFGAYDNSSRRGAPAAEDMTGGILANECETLLNDFFDRLRSE